MHPAIYRYLLSAGFNGRLRDNGRHGSRPPGKGDVMGYTDEDGRWHPEYITNAELAMVPLPGDAAQLAETFDADVWGKDRGDAVAEPLLGACRNGVFPDGLTLLRTCLHVQSRIVRVATQDDEAADEVALLDRLAARVRQRASEGTKEIEANFVAEHLTGGHAITSKVYDDPSRRPRRSLLAGLMLQPTTALRHPIETRCPKCWRL
jgi:hypothetical protein